MTGFAGLMGSLARKGDAWTVSVGDDWLQGRTLYGGLSSALCYEAATRQFADLPPLRAAQFAFVGPASGALTIRVEEMRRGKSTAFIDVDLIGEAGLATRAILCFGAARASRVTHSAVPQLAVPPPDKSTTFFGDAKPPLNFMQHFEWRCAGGNMPLSRASDPTMLLWLRHRDTATKPSVGSLLALADAPPPAAIVLCETFAPISTMTWSIDLHSDTIATDDGWFLVRTAADTVVDGYSGQAMTVWNAAGAPLMSSRQSVAVFI